MFKGYSTNCSLWPEHARPRRSNSLKFAAGSFLLGAVCAAAAYGLAFDFGAPAAAQRREPGQTAQSIPVYTATIEQPATTTPARVRGEDPVNQTRVTARKTTLPIIGLRTEDPPPVPTRGADSEKLVGETPEADIAKRTGPATSLARREDRPEQKPQAIVARSDEVKPAATVQLSGKPRKTRVEKTLEEPTRAERDPSEPVAEPPVRETRSIEAKPAATVERTAKRSKNFVEKNRGGSKGTVARNRQGREETTRYAKRQRPDQSSRTMLETALGALRQFTGGQDLLGL